MSMGSSNGLTGNPPARLLTYVEFTKCAERVAVSNFSCARALSLGYFQINLKLLEVARQVSSGRFPVRVALCVSFMQPPCFVARRGALARHWSRRRARGARCWLSYGLVANPEHDFPLLLGIARRHTGVVMLLDESIGSALATSVCLSFSVMDGFVPSPQF